MRKTLMSALVLALALIALPALADQAPATLDFDTLQGAEAATPNCNQRNCGAGQFCCNFSCSICAPLGGFCTQQVCPPVALSFEDTLAPMDVEPVDGETAEPAELELAPAPAEPAVASPATESAVEAKGGIIFPGGDQCNQAVCGVGEYCCNWSCSVCAPQGAACLDVYCPPES